MRELFFCFERFFGLDSGLGFGLAGDATEEGAQAPLEALVEVDEAETEAGHLAVVVGYLADHLADGWHLFGSLRVDESDR